MTLSGTFYHVTDGAEACPEGSTKLCAFTFLLLPIIFHSMKRIAILQSNYIPWKGYFDIINSVDEFVIYDDAQYTKRDWRNRNLIKTVNGVKWITIPIEVKHKYKQPIRETKVSGKNWANKHLKILTYNYSKAEHFNEIIEWLNSLYKSCEKKNYLSEINLLLINEISGFLGINTKISFSSDFILEGNKSGKAMNICLQAAADEYITGPAAKSYIDVEAFNKEGINVKWMDYSSYMEYKQLFKPFVHKVSIIDLIFNTGRKAPEFMNTF
jgi:hypothetical protein